MKRLWCMIVGHRWRPFGLWRRQFFPREVRLTRCSRCGHLDHSAQIFSGMSTNWMSIDFSSMPPAEGNLHLVVVDSHFVPRGGYR